MKDHIIWNMCSKSGKYQQVGKCPVNEAIWSMFMNNCMWTVFYLGEEGETFKRILMNREPDLNTSKNNALEFSGISSWQTGTQNPIIYLC